MMPTMSAFGCSSLCCSDRPRSKAPSAPLLLPILATVSALFATSAVAQRSEQQEINAQPEAKAQQEQAGGGSPVHMRAAVGEGVTIEAADGSFSLTTRARLQLRAETLLDPAERGVDKLAAQFAVRRARIQLEGDVLDKAFSWYVQLGMSPQDIELDVPVILRDANVTWHAPLGLDARLGQMKVPFDRQRITSSSRLQFPDRSRMMGELALDRDIGLQLSHESLLPNRIIDVRLGLFGGDGRNRPRPSSGLLWVARVQLSPLGGFEGDLTEGDIERLDRLRLAFAAGVAYNDRTPRPGSTVGDFLLSEEGEGFLDYAHATADMLIKWRGASLLLEGIARAATTDRGAPAAIARSGAGVLVQGGYMLTDSVEVVARAGWLSPLDASRWGGPENDPDLVPELETSAGANLYLIGHDLKVQLDGTGIFTAAGAQALGRLQLQLFF